MNHFCSIVATAFLTGTTLASDSTTAVQAKRPATGIGEVASHVVDAQSGEYLKDAKVEIVFPSDMAVPEKSSGITSAFGSYSLKAPIGAVSSRFAGDRLLTLSIASVLMGGARRIDKFINASAFIVRVSKPGYKTFEGTLRVVGADVEKFSTWLEPVELAPDSADFASFAAPYSKVFQFEHVEITGAVEPGKAVDVKVTVKNVPRTTPNPPDLKLRILGTLRFDGFKGKTDGSLTTYSGKVMTTDLPSNVGAALLGQTVKIPSALRGMAMAIDDSRMNINGPLVTRVFALEESSKLPSEIPKLVSDANQKIEDGHDVSSDLAKIDSVWSLANSAAIKRYVRSKTESVAEPLDENSLATKNIEFIRQGKAAEGWKFFGKAKKSLPDLFVNSFESAVAVEANPQNFEARAAIARDIRGLSQSSNPYLLRLRECLIEQPVPQLKAPQTPAEAYYAATILYSNANYSSAITALNGAKSDSKMGPAAKALSAQCLAASGDQKGALAEFDSVMANESGKSLKSFYTHLNYATLLLLVDRYQDAEAALVRALALARGSTEDYSAPASQGYYAGSSYSVYTSAAVSGTIGYAYPEAAAAQRVLFYFKGIEGQGESPSIRGLLARSLADIGAIHLARKIAEELPKNEEISELALAHIAYVEGKKAEAKACASRALKANSRNLEAAALIESLR